MLLASSSAFKNSHRNTSVFSILFECNHSLVSTWKKHINFTWSQKSTGYRQHQRVFFFLESTFYLCGLANGTCKFTKHSRPQQHCTQKRYLHIPQKFLSWVSPWAAKTLAVQVNQQLALASPHSTSSSSTKVQTLWWQRIQWWQVRNNLQLFSCSIFACKKLTWLNSATTVFNCMSNKTPKKPNRDEPPNHNVLATNYQQELEQY